MSTLTDELPRKLNATQIRKLELAMACIKSAVTSASGKRPPQVAEIAAGTGWSARWFRDLFAMHFGETVKEVVDRLLIDEAKRLLLAGVAVREIARLLGFVNEQHLTSRFRIKTNNTPARWRGGQRAATDAAEPKHTEVSPC